MSFYKKYLDGRLPFLIGHVPKPLKRGFVYTYTGKKSSRYEAASDATVKYDTQKKGTMYGFGALCVAIGLFMIWFAPNGHGLEAAKYLCLVSLPFFVWGFLTPRKTITFDRLAGTITYPDWFFRPHRTVAFDDLTVVWVGTGGASGALGQRLVAVPPSTGRLTKSISLDMHTIDMAESWSLIVWYMDRNRPLPPGDAFDAYRDRDFERRRREGFPPPLYPSRFPIPEALPWQQARRDRHWRDHQYFGTSETAWY